jgi:hypothetical protein
MMIERPRLAGLVFDGIGLACSASWPVRADVARAQSKDEIEAR